MENYIRKYKMEGGANSEGDIINVTLTSISGFSVVIPAPGNMSFKDLFSTYKYEVKKADLIVYIIDNDYGITEGIKKEMTKADIINI